MERLLSAPAFQFKGSGWYVTDYAKSSTAPSAKNETAKSDGASDAKSAESKPAETKTESKPAVTTKTD